MTWHIVKFTNLKLLKKKLILTHQEFWQKLYPHYTAESHFIQVFMNFWFGISFALVLLHIWLIIKLTAPVICALIRWTARYRNMGYMKSVLI